VAGRYRPDSTAANSWKARRSPPSARGSPSSTPLCFFTLPYAVTLKQAFQIGAAVNNAEYTSYHLRPRGAGPREVPYYGTGAKFKKNQHTCTSRSDRRGKGRRRNSNAAREASAGAGRAGRGDATVGRPSSAHRGPIGRPRGLFAAPQSGLRHVPAPYHMVPSPEPRTDHRTAMASSTTYKLAAPPKDGNADKSLDEDDEMRQLANAHLRQLKQVRDRTCPIPCCVQSVGRTHSLLSVSRSRATPALARMSLLPQSLPVLSWLSVLSRMLPDLLTTPDPTQIGQVNEAAKGMVKSTSTEILCQYNQQPIHVRSRAEQWELSRSEIQLTTKLGEGDGGVIYHAHWRGLDVVAKMLKTEGDRPSAMDGEVARADLINEISVLSRLRHPNLVMFLGACTVKEPLIILNEYLSGVSLCRVSECPCDTALSSL